MADEFSVRLPLRESVPVHAMQVLAESWERRVEKASPEVRAAVRECITELMLRCSAPGEVPR